jgi:hypothetical protein
MPWPMTWLHIQNMSLRDSAPPTHVANLVVYNPRNAEGHQAPYQAPPIHLLTIPAPYQAGRFNQGLGGRIMGGHTCRCPRHAGRSPNFFGAAGQGANQAVFVHGGVVRPPQGQYSPAKATVPHDNTPTLVKKYNNWNVCCTCGFDVEAMHNLVICPFDWHRPGHCKRYTRANAKLYINCGHDVCTKGIHKTMLPPA